MVFRVMVGFAISVVIVTFMIVTFMIVTFMIVVVVAVAFRMARAWWWWRRAATCKEGWHCKRGNKDQKKT